MSTLMAVGVGQRARPRTRRVGGLALLAATATIVALAGSVHNKAAVPLVVIVGLVVAATWTAAGVLGWDGTSVPVPALAGLSSAAGLAASRLSGGDHRLGAALA